MGLRFLQFLVRRESGFSGDGGPATQAKMNGPFGVVRGPDGCLYVCDTYNHCMRKIDAKGIVTTVAGLGGKKGYKGDGGVATKALLNEPYEVRFDKAGDMYFVEMMNHVIRKVDMKSGKISTIAGTGSRGLAEMEERPKMPGLTVRIVFSLDPKEIYMSVILVIIGYERLI